MDFKNYFKELKRRNVFKAALAYLVVAWVIIQLASIAFPAFGVPNPFLKGVFILLLLGFPIWLVFAWIYELTPEGLKKTEEVEKEKSITTNTSSKFNKLIIGALAIAILLLGANLYSNYSEKDITAATSDKKVIEKQEKSVAVLAFDNMSSDKDQEYFSDGISEEILNFLAKNPDLEVISRTSSFSYKGKEVTIKTIAKELGVNYILEGSVRKSGSTLRITAQLVNTKTGNNMWSETYDREMDDIFKIQDDIAGEVTKNLEASLLGRKIQAVNTEAYTKYLQAKSLRMQFTPEAVGKAKELIDLAIQIDSSYAPIWYIKGRVEANLDELRKETPTKKEIKKLKSYFQKAIELDPDYADAYVRYAWILNVEGKNAEYKRILKKALQLEKDNAQALSFLSLDRSLPLEQRLKFMKKAMSLDPLYYPNNYYLSFLYFEKGDYQQALEALNIYILHYPNASQTYNFQAELLALTGKFEEAKKALEKETDEFQQLYVLPLIYIGMGDKQKAREAIKNFENKYADLSPNSMAQYYAYLNEKEKAYKWLDITVKDVPFQAIQIKYDPYLDNLRGEKRFQEIVKKIDLPEVKPLDIDID